MKLYDENNEMNHMNETEQNRVADTTNEPHDQKPMQNQDAQNQASVNPAQATPMQNAPMQNASMQNACAQNASQNDAPYAQPMQNTQPTQNQSSGSYAYTRENIPDNTYRPQPNSGYTPYTNGAQNPQNGGQPNPYMHNAQYGAPQYHAPQNGYDPTHGYSPMQDGSRISYTPDNNVAKEKRAKKKGNGKKAAVAVACCCGLLFSTGFGFLGAVIANRVYPSGEKEEIVVDTNGNVVSQNQKTAVFYKSVDNISTSTTSAGGDLTMAQVSAMVGDTVVEITTEFLNTSGWFQYISSGAGSGVILSEDGYIITNNHVICGEDGTTPADTIKVRLTNGTEYDATLVGTDSDSDVAVLKIEAKGLTPAICGDSDKLVVGETVLAVGNPLGELGGTQTDGIISALDREIDVNGTSMTLLQTSAAVNPGNSGGALFNMRGELIGVVNAKSSGTGIEGLGFAIPINDALNVAEQLMEYGYVRGKVAIGVSFYECEDALTARYYGLPGYGVYVMELSKGYNENVLQVLDRVISIDGQEISSFSDISNIVKSHSVGDVLKFQVSRDGKIIEVDVTCYEKIPTEIGEVEFDEN